MMTMVLGLVYYHHSGAVRFCDLSVMVVRLDRARHLEERGRCS
jgi:hypothetical protein